MRFQMVLHAAVLVAIVAGCGPERRLRSPERDYRVGSTIIPVESAVIAPDACPWQDSGDGTRRKVYFNDRLTVVLVEISGGDARPAPPPHQHSHDQVGYVIEGRALVTLGGRTQEIGPGGVYVVTSNMPHGFKPLTPRLILVEAFTPTREDFRKPATK